MMEIWTKILRSRLILCCDQYKGIENIYKIKSLLNVGWAAPIKKDVIGNISHQPHLLEVTYKLTLLNDDLIPYQSSSKFHQLQLHYYRQTRLTET